MMPGSFPNLTTHNRWIRLISIVTILMFTAISWEHIHFQIIDYAIVTKNANGSMLSSKIIRGNTFAAEEQSSEELATRTEESTSEIQCSSNEFCNRYCKLNDVDWYTNSTLEWQRRAPYYILGGAKKAGTTSLANFLGQHSSIANPSKKELLTFLDSRWNSVSKNGKILVKHARAKMYNQDRTFYPIERLKQNKNMVSFDATPGYLFFSNTTPQRILCVAPWVKLVFILRNPVDRAWSNYNFYKQACVPEFIIPFEKWIDHDIQLLTQAGVNQDWNVVEFDTFSGSPEEIAAWERYHALLKVEISNSRGRCAFEEGPVARGIYVIQLRQWFQAVTETGRNPSSEIYIARTEDMKAESAETVAQILSFLGLSGNNAVINYEERMVTKYGSSPFPEATKKQLQDFYAPYNKKLHQFLGKDWNGIWDVARGE